MNLYNFFLCMCACTYVRTGKKMKDTNLSQKGEKLTSQKENCDSKVEFSSVSFLSPYYLLKFPFRMGFCIRVQRLAYLSVPCM